MENLFLQIFDRKNWIEDQLRQQAQSYYQSLASNLLAKGRNPPPWLWSAISGGADCGPPQEMRREQLISGILTSFPQAATPSVNRNLLFRQSILNDYSLQSNFFGGTCVPASCIPTMTCEESEKHLLGDIHDSESLIREDVDTSQNPGESAKGQKPCMEPQSQEIHERSDHSSKERRSRNESGSKMQSRVNSVNLDFVEDPSTLNSSLHSTSEHNSKVDHPKSVSPQVINSERSGLLLNQIGEDEILESPFNQTKFSSQNLDSCPISQDRIKFISHGRDLSANSQKPCIRPRNPEIKGTPDDTGKLMDSRKGCSEKMRLGNLSAKLDLAGSSVLNAFATSSMSKDKMPDSKSVSSKQVDSQRSNQFSDQVEEVGSRKALDRKTNFLLQNFDACPTINNPACNTCQVTEQDSPDSQTNLRMPPFILNAHAETRQSYVGSVEDNMEGKFNVSLLQREKHHSVQNSLVYDNGLLIPGSNATADLGLSSKQLVHIDPVIENTSDDEEANIVLGIGKMEGYEVSELESIPEPLGEFFKNDIHHYSFPSQDILIHEDPSTCPTSIDVAEQCQILDLPLPSGSLRESLTDMSLGTNDNCSGSCTKESFQSLGKIVNTDRNSNPLPAESYVASGEVQEFESVNMDASSVDASLQDGTPMRSLPKKVSEGKLLWSHSSSQDKNHITAMSNSSQVVTSWDHDRSKSDEKSKINVSLRKEAASFVSDILTPVPNVNEPKQCLAEACKIDTSHLSDHGEDASGTCLTQESKKYSSNELSEELITSCNDITPIVPEILDMKYGNHEGTMLNAEAPNSMGTIQPSNRYFLRRSTRLRKEVISKKPSYSGRSENAISQDSCVTWPQGRKKNHQSGNVFHTISKANPKPVLEASGINATQQNSSMNKFDLSEERNSELLCSKSPLEDILSNLQKLKDASAVMEEHGPFQVTTEEQNRHASECGTDAIQLRSLAASDYSASKHLNYEVDLCLKSSPSRKIDIAVFSGSLPELEGFSFAAAGFKDGVTSRNPDSEFSLHKSANFFEGAGACKNIDTPLCNSSPKFAVHDVPGIYSSLPSGLLEQFNLSDSFHLNGGNSTLSKDGTVIHFFGSRASDPDCYLRKGFTEDMTRSSLLEIDAKRLFTPPVQKHFNNFALERSGCSSGKISSNPELVCFRIDENCSMDEEDVLPDKDDEISQQMAFSNENPSATCRIALADVSSFYQNVPTMTSTSANHPERGSLDSVSTEAYLESEMNDFKTIAKGKENPPSSCKNSQKYGKALRNRQSKRKISAKEKDQEHSLGHSTKKCKPSNIVSNISSFVPLIQQKQAVVGPGKKDIKVKALEAAEVAKRLAEKKQKEREMRKEALRLERVRMEQENIRLLELERKQKEEERRKKEAQAEARKRQREEEAKKEKERKRKCNESRRQQHEDKIHNEKRDLRPKDATKNCVKKEARTLSTERGSEVIDTIRQSDLEQNSACRSDQHISDDGEVTNAHDMEKDNLCRNFVVKESHESESYEISPYRDSDNEDEEDSKQKRKLVPKWAWRETATLILASQKLTDLENVFCKKRSCCLDEVHQVQLRFGLFNRMNAL